MEMGQEKQTIFARMIGAIAQSIRLRATPMQRMACAVMTALLAFAALPGGYYCCQTAMFAVLIRLGFCVPEAFAGVIAGGLIHYACGNMIACWQLPAAAGLWLLCGLWTQGQRRSHMAAAIFAAVISCALIADLSSPLQAAALALTGAMGAGLCVLYDGAALCVAHRDELDGETRPLCVMAVCASLAAAMASVPGGEALALAFAAYMTLEHAFAGGGAQSVLCGGLLGGVLSLCLLRVEPCAMLLCGGFLAGEIRTRRRMVCALLMALGMAGVGAALGFEMRTQQVFASCAAGFVPFLLLSAQFRAPVSGLIEHLCDPEVTQSEAVAVRCAAMMHAWSRLYADTGRMMQGLLSEKENREMAMQCVDLLEKTSAAAHQVCERTLGSIRPDDEAYRAMRYALVQAGLEEVRAAYALRIEGRLEMLLLKPEHIAPASLCPLVSRACGAAMQPCARENLLSTQALFEQTPPLCLEVGAALRSRSGELVAGDGYLSRALPGGRHALALSDGMGCGEGAMQQSHTALSLLADSLQAGYSREQALDAVNALMLMCTGQELYATIDLCVIDLHGAQAAFEKLGACASFVVHAGQVRTVTSDTLPVGVLRQVESASQRIKIAAGDVIVMMSDGVLLSYPGGEAALCDAIEKLCWLHPQAVGERLIAAALSGGEAKDDMTVLCARVGKTMGAF